MCGIIAYVGPRDVRPILLDGLSRLEYRGYDSAGIATLADGQIDIQKNLQMEDACLYKTSFNRKNLY